MSNQTTKKLPDLEVSNSFLKDIEISQNSFSIKSNLISHHSTLKGLNNIKKYLSEEYKNLDYDIDTLLFVLKKTKHNQEEIPFILSFFMKSQLHNYLSLFRLNDDKIKNLFLALTSFITVNDLKKNKIICRKDDKSKILYLLVKGEVEIRNLSVEEVKMSGFNYFKYLINLKKKNEKDIFLKTLKKNYKNFPIHYKDRFIISFIAFKLLYEDYIIEQNLQVNLRRNTYQFELKELNKIHELLNLCLLDLIQDFGIKIEFNIDNLTKIKEIIKKNLENKLINNYLLSYYTFLIDDTKIKTVKIYKEINYVIDKEGEIIGKEEKGKYIETAISNTECKLISFSSEILHKYIEEEKIRIIGNEAAFLNYTSLFKQFRYSYFQKFFYEQFQYCEYSKGEIINKESNDYLEYIYLIREGEVLLTIKYNKETIDNLISFIINRKNFNYKNDYLYFLGKDDNSNKEILKIITLNKYDFCGCELLYFNLPNLFSIKALKDKTKIYKIHSFNFQKILEDNPSILEKYKFHSKNRLDSIINSLKNYIIIQSKNQEKTKKEKLNNFSPKNIPRLKTTIFNISSIQNNINKSRKSYNNSLEKLLSLKKTSYRNNNLLYLNTENKSSYLQFNPNISKTSDKSNFSFEDNFMKKIKEISTSSSFNIISLFKKSNIQTPKKKNFFPTLANLINNQKNKTKERKILNSFSLTQNNDNEKILKPSNLKSYLSPIKLIKNLNNHPLTPSPDKLKIYKLNSIKNNINNLN